MALARAGGRIRGAPACWMLSSASGGSLLAYGTRHLMPEAANGSGPDRRRRRHRFLAIEISLERLVRSDSLRRRPAIPNRDRRQMVDEQTRRSVLPQLESV